MTFGIVGLGLMGGSIARDLNGRLEPTRVVGWDADPGQLEAATEIGAIDEPAPDAAALAESADTLIYATPLGVTLELLDAHAPLWRDDALVMDVASLKRPVLERIRTLGVGPRWIGAHPMAGGERSGFDASREKLFKGSAVWLTHVGLEQTRDGATGEAHALGQRAEAFWTALGALPQWTEAGIHDLRMVRTSHLPQVLANALGAVLGESGLTRADLGRGGREMTRLAGSAPELWAPLFAESAGPLSAAVRETSRMLEALASALEAREVDRVVDLMVRTRRWKEGEPWR